MLSSTFDIFDRHNWIIDLSGQPLELVAKYVAFRDWRFDPEWRHPDLWSDWRWVDAT